MLCTKFLNSSDSSSSLVLSQETLPSAKTLADTKIGASTLIATAIASEGLASISISFPSDESKYIVEK